MNPQPLIDTSVYTLALGIGLVGLALLALAGLIAWAMTRGDDTEGDQP